ncbi:hypothetical protein [Burkholderia gladioli]|uniref:hypothetical protein n=1 Tax=Burkholderia gladioli TaxID=28095 RepID=UPI0019074154|nr:hypothetical protein [Burkholderia gladioli]MBJ9659124.1 hypothetical protein [Burkholderia gladioli]
MTALALDPRETVIAENPGVRPQLVDDLIWTIRRGAFGPEVQTVYSSMVMGGTLRITPALLDLAGEKAGVLRAQQERGVLDQVADEAMLTRAAEDALASTGQAQVSRQRARL